jgi:hypothetical protein
MSQSYEHLHSVIEKFFKNKGGGVNFKPGRRIGSDFIETGGAKLIGEIKHREELCSLSNFWYAWNSNQKFGGKSHKYRLKSEFDQDIDDIGLCVRGWIAIIYGQLRNYSKFSGNKGWLVIESYSHIKCNLETTISYLVKVGKVARESIEIIDDVAFILFNFNQLQNCGVSPMPA